MTKSRDEKLASLDRRHFDKLNKEAKKKHKEELNKEEWELAMSLANLKVKNRST